MMVAPIADVDLYQSLALRTDGINADWVASFLERIGSEKGARLLNAALGMAGEAGEFADLIKKWAFHGHQLDVDKLRKEIGDVRWYTAQATTALDTLLSEIDGGNIDKLAKRYPAGFSSHASINRVD